jgi:hypothetical protein|tara:strand:+ start:339 stop:641 length:303 start_codon:yes stop_codon:yes gene_type:complete
MKLKHSVKLTDLQPQTLLAMLVAEEVYREAGADFVITSVNDSRHMTNSLHYSGYAFDCRIWTLEEDMRQPVANDIAAALGEDFDVILEDDHMHIEHDPQG